MSLPTCEALLKQGTAYGHRSTFQNTWLNNIKFNIQNECSEVLSVSPALHMSIR